MKTFLRKYSYSLKVGLNFYFLAVVLIVLSIFRLPLDVVGFVISPLSFFIAVLILGPILHIFASVLIIILVLYKYRKVKKTERFVILVGSLLSLFLVDIVFSIILIIYTVLNQTICGIFGTSNICALFLTS